MMKTERHRILLATSFAKGTSAWGCALRARSEAFRNAPSAAARRRILAGGASMMGSSVVTSILGVVFWIVAARMYSREAVGLAAALIALIGIAGLVGALGIGTLLMGQLPLISGGRSVLILTGASVAGAVGAGLGGAAALLAPAFSSTIRAQGATGAHMILIATGASLTAATIVLDSASLAVWPAGHVLRNTTYCVSKLVCLGVVAVRLSSGTGFAVLGAWVMGLALSLVVLPGFVRIDSTRLRFCDLGPSFRMLSELRWLAVRHQVVNLAMQAPTLALPVVVAGTVSLATNADFYVAWMVAALLFMVPSALSAAVYPVTIGEMTSLRYNIRFSLILSGMIALLGYLLLILFAEPFFRLFGSHYSQHAAPAVAIIALGVFPVTIKGHYVALKRISGELGHAGGLLLAGAALELGFAATGSRFGLQGVCGAWLLAVCLESLLMARPVWQALVVGPTRPGHLGSATLHSPYNDRDLRPFRTWVLRLWRRIVCRPGFREIPAARILMGGQGGMSGIEFASRIGCLTFTSVPISAGPHADLLRRALRAQTEISDTEILASSYGRMATACIQATGSFFGAEDGDGIVLVAREFIDRARGSMTVQPRPGRSGANEPIVVAAIRHSDCYQMIDGHHRAAIDVCTGSVVLRVRVRWLSVRTALQAHLLKMSWLGGRRELYQPIGMPEVPPDRWPVVRRCTDRFLKMTAFLNKTGVQPPASYLDVASCYGWFVSEMANRGFESSGIERDSLALDIGKYVYGLPADVIHVGEAGEWLASCSRKWDVVTCFSLLHHILRASNEAGAAEFIRLLASVTRRILLLDAGQDTEEWFRKSLKGWSPKRYQEFLLSQGDWSEVIDLGPDEDAVPPFERNYGRHLFACIRARS
jgi:O-antigen/teichoic acid export membrane protein